MNVLFCFIAAVNLFYFGALWNQTYNKINAETFTLLKQNIYYFLSYFTAGLV